MMNWDLRCEATISMPRPRASRSFHRWMTTQLGALPCRPRRVWGQLCFSRHAGVGLAVLWGPASASMPKLTA
jgi:hypothetical protein